MNSIDTEDLDLATGGLGHCELLNNSGHPVTLRYGDDTRMAPGDKQTIVETDTFRVSSPGVKGTKAYWGTCNGEPMGIAKNNFPHKR